MASTTKIMTCIIALEYSDPQEKITVSETSYDSDYLARIMKYCIMDSPQKEKFLEISSTMQYSFTDVSGANTYQCNNHNTLFYMLDGVISGRTGFAGNAGYQ